VGEGVKIQDPEGVCTKGKIAIEGHRDLVKAE